MGMGIDQARQYRLAPRVEPWPDGLNAIALNEDIRLFKGCRSGVEDVSTGAQQCHRVLLIHRRNRHEFIQTLARLW